MTLRSSLALTLIVAWLHAAACTEVVVRNMKVVSRPTHMKASGKMKKITHLRTPEGWKRVDLMPHLHPKPTVSPVSSRRTLKEAAASPPPPLLNDTEKMTKTKKKPPPPKKKPPPPSPPESSPPPPPAPPPPEPLLPETCSPSLYACCDHTDSGLRAVPKASVDGVAPFSSTVQLILHLYYENGDEYGIGGCSGTVAKRADVILTAGHCLTEYSFLGSRIISDNIRAYFNVYDGLSYDYEPIIKAATWKAWVEEEVAYADQALFQLQNSKDPALVMPTEDIRKKFNRLTGYKEPYNSIGFPGFNFAMMDTPNSGGRCMRRWDTDAYDDPSIKGTYALYLPIMAGMSGGGVFTNDTRLFATNDFSLYFGNPDCLRGNCYNGYTAIDDYKWPLKKLLQKLGKQQPPEPA